MNGEIFLGCRQESLKKVVDYQDSLASLTKRETEYFELQVNKVTIVSEIDSL